MRVLPKIYGRAREDRRTGTLRPLPVLGMVDAAVSAGLLDLCWMNRLRLLDPLRGDPRFEALRGRVQERAARVGAAWRGPEETLDEALASLR